MTELQKILNLFFLHHLNILFIAVFDSLLKMIQNKFIL